MDSTKLSGKLAFHPEMGVVVLPINSRYENRNKLQQLARNI